MEKDYIEIEVSICTNVVGSDCTTTVEIYNDDLEGMTEQEKSDYIEEVCKDAAFDMVDWSYKTIN